MIYVILYSMCVGAHGSASDVFHSASLNQKEAEKLYSDLILSKRYYEKSLWQIDSKGVRTKLKNDIFDEGT